jgi:hypothetical protein
MNCKPPCMALIIKSDFPELIGLPVEVTTESADFYGEFCWVVKASRPIPCWNESTGLDDIANEIAVPDSCLRPITGLPDSESITRFVDITVKVTA